MKDSGKTKKQRIDEMEALRARVLELEGLEAERKGEMARSPLMAIAVEQSTEGMAVVDMEGNILFLNKAFANMHGYDPDELVGKNLSLFHTPEQMPSVDAANRELREKGTFSGEIWHARRDGTVFPAWMENSLFRDGEGNPVGMIGTLGDITELKQTEEALQASEARFRELATHIREVFWLFDVAEQRVIYASPAYEEIWGRPLQDLYDRYSEWANSIHPEDVDHAAASFSEMARSGGGEAREYRIVRPDGTVRWISDKGFVIRGDGGEAVRIAGVAEDITDRKRTEADLKESEQNYRNLVDNALVGIFKRNIAGDIYYMNQALLSMLEYDSVHDLRSVRFVDAYEDPGDRDRLLEALKEKGKVVGHELRLLTKTGKTKSVLINAVIEHGIMSGMMMDITDRKVMEEELRQNEERHRALFEGSLDAILLADPESGEVIDANPAASELFLRSRRGLAGLHHADLYPSRLRAEVVEAFAGIVNDRDQDQPIETTILCSDGTERPVEVMAHIIQIDGRLVVYQEFRDISERKNTADALQRTMERYRTLFDDSPISLWEEDYSEVKQCIERLRNEGVADFRDYFERHPEVVEQCAAMVQVVDVNEATLHVYEATSKEDFLAGLGQLFTEQSYKDFREGLIAIAEGRTYFEIETVNRTLAGRRKDIQLRWSVPRGYEKTLARLLVSIVDISDRNRMEQELGNIQRLQSLGVLAGGIAHDFNNILTAILANISMARLYGDLDEEVAHMLTDAERASLRAQGLTQQLLTFAKGGEPVKKHVRLSELLKESAGFALSGSNTRCEYSMQEGLWVVDADEGQLNQVFQNLVINADQAMPEGGVIWIRAENVRMGKNEKGELKEGAHVKVSVQDQGGGIPREQLPKIFDPFFTTKERGRGLGLAIAFSIVNRHAGHMEVDSALGGGTTFHVYLPAHETAAAPAEGLQDEPARGAGRVLVVDDEGIIRRSTGTVLERLGYEADLAKDGREGIEIYQRAKKEDRPFLVVIMDLTIPGEMGGEETVQRLRDLDPDAKVIVSSGYSDDPVMSQFREYGFDGVLRKPYTVADLAAVIREVSSGRGKDRGQR